ncbi:MAG: hypothetical protein KAW88_01465 [Candidatus Cloacimonetes bacterium]|nr:hypothetical protein [Candidatus Cloacimonadota bacterium]
MEAKIKEIKLPDYKKIAGQTQRKKVEVTKEEIEKLRLGKEQGEKERARQEIIENIVKETDLEISEILIQEEQKRIMERLKQQVPQILQISFEDYLAKLNKTEKELLDSFLPEAEKRLKIFLVLKEIQRKENITVFEAEIEDEMNKALKQTPGKEENKNIDLDKLKNYIKETLKNEKTFQLLESFIQ